MTKLSMQRALLCCLVWVGAAQAQVADEVADEVVTLVDAPRLVNTAQEPSNWLTHGLNYAEDRHSQLERITPDNVANLGLAWYFDTNTTRGLEASPLVIDGVMYSTTSWSQVFAHNAVTGELLWHYDPQVPKAWGVNACCDVVNRGVAAWGDKVFVGTLDGRLVALDRHTGEVVWSVLTIDRARPYTITGAPRAVNGKIIIGNGGAEYGVRGYVGAYAAETGEQLWRFYTVPGDPEQPYESATMEMAAKTWTGDRYWKVGGGGTVWDSMAFDAELNLLYVGVGNGSPWNRWIRSPDGGDNLFLSSIVALNADTGEYVWHYQTTPADTWDFTATQHIILAELEIQGELRKVLMQAPKNGFFYVLDRTSGELLSAHNYVPVTWASEVDMATGRPVLTEEANHFQQEQTTSPAAFGGHNWQPMAFNKQTGLVYIPAIEASQPFSTDPAFKFKPGSEWNLGQANPLGKAGAVADLPAPLLLGVMKNLMRGKLIAWDPIAGEERWRVDHPTVWNGGLLSTNSDLVFQGTGDRRLVAYRASTGELLWEVETGTGVVAPPVTYAVDGEQYVAVLAGWGGVGGLSLPQTMASNGTSRLLVYKLGGTASHPVEPIVLRLAEAPPAATGTSEQIAAGSDLFAEHCLRCHGMNVGSGGVVQDLRYINNATHQIFNQIVLEGVYSGLGMVSFAHVLDEEQADNVHHYLIDQANLTWEAQNASGWWHDFTQWFYEQTGLALGSLMAP